LNVGRFFIELNPASESTSFRHALLAWYRKQGRDLPWRRTRDPYAILVSEFMLQQTQVTTVIPYYNEWMRRFPDFAALAAASEQEVLRAWQGLGYYSRARNLRATAIAVIEKHGGCLPRSLDAIQSLPGIGRYTAHAVATFAFNRAVPIVEANITRLLARLFNLQIPIDTSAGREALWSRATELLPARGACRHNSALMDLGSIVCGTRPRCEVCPVTSFCRTLEPASLPRKKARPAIRFLTENHSFAVRRSRVLLEQSEGRWRGMWMLPRLEKPPRLRNPLHVSEFSFTNHRITLMVFPQTAGAPRAKSSERWFHLDALPFIPLPSPHRRALEAIIREA
jgi:A/G-specific adenine glycosylase